MVMQSFIPTNVVAAMSATPLPNAAGSASRSMASSNEASFSRQLEQSRQTHAEKNAHPAPQDKAPSTASKPPANNTQRPAGSEHPAQRHEAERPARSAAPRDGKNAAKAGSTNQKAEPDSPAAGAADPDVKHTDESDPAGQDMLALLGIPTDAPAAPADPALTPPQASATPPTPAAEPPLTAAAANVPAAMAQAGTVESQGNDKPSAVVERSPTAALAERGHLPAQAGARSAPGTGPQHNDSEVPTWQQAQATAHLADSATASPEARESRQPEPITATDRSAAPHGIVGLTGQSPHTAKAGEVATASLATPATSPEFRAAFGAQVSYFARSGVQQAELHLNPAEMGPVSIQIVLDGQQAQVNFGADSALTRQIIESGMPELASALRDAGLTLTGGGVSQHAGGQRQDQGSSGPQAGAASGGRAGNSSDEAMGAPLAQARRSAVRSALGGVDLYA